MIISLLAITGIYFYSQQSIITFNFYQIHELKQSNFTSGNFNIEGYVVEIETCPPCPLNPAAGVCQPCSDNVVISENNILLKTYLITEKELIVFMENPERLELGKKYMFSVKILNRKSTAGPINDVELIGFELIE